MDKKLNHWGCPWTPLGASDPRLGSRWACARHDPLFGQILDPPLHVGSGSEVPEAEHIAITILQRCVNQKPRNFFQHWNLKGGCPLVSFPTPLVISIAIVSSIAILLLDTYRGRNFRYRPALLTDFSDFAPFTDHFITFIFC